MKTKTTILTIAKELGYAKSTVSKALNDSHEISLETRKKIKAFALQHNYKPNIQAIKLRTKKTMLIGVVIPEIVHHFFSKVISGIEKIAKDRNYNLVICLSNESYEKEVQNIKMLSDGSVDGILISVSNETLKKNNFSHFKSLKNNNVPFVLFDKVSDEIECDKVVVDDIGGGFKATKYLIDRGCKKIAILSTGDYINVSQLRFQGYLKALNDNNIEIDEELIIKIDHISQANDEIAKLFNKSSKFPDGIFAVNEVFAALALKTAQKRNIHVPDELAIIGFTDGLISKFCTPSLSAIAQHGFTMGEQAAELLLNRILMDKTLAISYERKVISTNLKIREST